MEEENKRPISPKAVVIIIAIMFGLPILIWAIINYPSVLYLVLLLVGMIVYLKLKKMGVIN